MNLGPPVVFIMRSPHRERKPTKRKPGHRPAFCFSIGAEMAPKQVVARIDRSLFLYPVGGRYDMLEWL
jgi:hypothetical protein